MNKKTIGIEFKSPEINHILMDVYYMVKLTSQINEEKFVYAVHNVITD